MLVRTATLYAQCCVLLFSTLFIFRDYILASHLSSVPFFFPTSFLSLSLFPLPDLVDLRAACLL